MSSWFDTDNPYYFLMQVAFEDTIPLGWHVDLTYRCDLSCSHCYLEDRRRREMTVDEYREFFAELADLGCLYLLVSGGDLFVRPDAMEILRAAARHQFDMTLITHAMAIDEGKADELADMGVRSVNVSVYHADPEIHDRVTRRQGSWERTVAAIRRLRERDVGVAIKCPVMDINQGAERVMQELADDLGALLALSPVMRGGNAGNDDLLSLNMGLDAKADVYECVYTGIDTLGNLTQYSAEDRTCLAGHASGYLSPDGTVQPCLDYEQSAGNIRDTRLTEIWKTSPLFNKLRGIRRSDFEGCTKCENYSFCGLCPALAARETGDPTGSAPSRCRETTAMRYAFERKEAEREAAKFDLLQTFGLAPRSL